MRLTEQSLYYLGKARRIIMPLTILWSFCLVISLISTLGSLVTAGIPAFLVSAAILAVQFYVAANLYKHCSNMEKATLLHDPAMMETALAHLATATKVYAIVQLLSLLTQPILAMF